MNEHDMEAGRDLVSAIFLVPSSLSVLSSVRRRSHEAREHRARNQPGH